MSSERTGKDGSTRSAAPGRARPVGETDHHIHPITARFSLVEYADFECPDCAEGFHVVNELLRDLGDDLCFAFRNFPLREIHPNAQFAAEAAEAADMQGKFWLMHDRLFEHQAELSPPRIRDLAREMSLDIHHFDEDLASGAPRRRVDSDREEGVRLGLHGTPAFFANGRLQPPPYDYHPLFDALTATKRTQA